MTGEPAQLWRVGPDDVRRLTDRLLVTEGDARVRKLSAFWVLIVLSSVIATAGVEADSTATVIGAMIVAPLMTPILGTALSVVLARRKLIAMNLVVVVAGAASVVVIAYLLGMVTQLPMTADTNSQIAARVAPRLVDLLAALATGIVGAFAMVRYDISDTLPGVAIAISLVPPLAVVGLTLESGQPDQALGALLLFGTNVTAIIATGTLVFLAYRIRQVAVEVGEHVGKLRAGTIAVVIGALVVLAVPLAIGSTVVVQKEILTAQATPVVRQVAEQQGWEVQTIDLRQGALNVVVLAAATEGAATAELVQQSGLRRELDAQGLAELEVVVTMIRGGSLTLPGK